MNVRCLTCRVCLWRQQVVWPRASASNTLWWKSARRKRASQQPLLRELALWAQWGELGATFTSCQQMRCVLFIQRKLLSYHEALFESDRVVTFQRYSHTLQLCTDKLCLWKHAGNLLSDRTKPPTTSSWIHPLLEQTRLPPVWQTLQQHSESLYICM